MRKRHHGGAETFLAAIQLAYLQRASRRGVGDLDPSQRDLSVQNRRTRRTGDDADLRAAGEYGIAMNGEILAVDGQSH